MKMPYDYYDITARGIPALARVTGCDPEDFDFEICDKAGKPAAWIERRMTPGDWRHVEEQVQAALQRESEARYWDGVDAKIDAWKEGCYV